MVENNILFYTFAHLKRLLLSENIYSYIIKNESL